ncbi:DDB1- and CUL4-associated factor 8 [Trachymyrmex septentrionalis]|uniref:DDB1-and CUL4-associated factor 8 n=1 Tax=Trachymyrmex septentrionalis TaxID=34720 RepID=A0A195EY77_9HYME|nr:DDB1- and CUL4-associated factor 8 [Trachymyrmex septentrionalis]
MNLESEVSDDTNRNLVDLSQATLSTSQDNNLFLSYTNEANILHTDQNEIESSISKCQVQTSSHTSIEKSDESLSKRQKLNESVCNTSDKQEEDKDEDETNKKVAGYLKLKEKSPNWHIVPEVINRQIGSNPLFKRRFHSSSYAVEQFQLMYKLYLLNDNNINILNFNHKGNLLMCAVYNKISIWDWAVGKKSFSFTNDDDIFFLDAKWLPSDNYVAFSATHNRICLLEIESNMSKKLLMQNGGVYKLSVHPETPHVILLAGMLDSKVLSIDIRESKPKELLEVKENSLNVLLTSIDSNPSNSNEFCVAGESWYVTAYDRRKVSEPLYKLGPYDVHEKCVFVKSAKYNYNGTEILASYNCKHLFLFNRLIRSSRGDYGHMYQNDVRSSSRLYIKLHCFTITLFFIHDYCSFFGPKSEYVVATSIDNIFSWEKNSESVIQCIRGDKKFVACLESHPHIPILATSGYDDNVKLWVSSKGELSVMGSVGKVHI